MIKRATLRAMTLIALIPCVCGPAIAGPPFVTDDPEPVDYLHWEVYLASIYQRYSNGNVGTLPHLELNYGGAPNIQLAVFLPLAIAGNSAAPQEYGLGDIQFGVKWRFMQEGHNRPMVAVYPQVSVPTGDSSRGTGSGQTAIFLPIWLQKSWGPWTTYGGGGYWFNLGIGNGNYSLTGWLIQKDLSKRLTLGGEIYYMSSPGLGISDQLNFNVGGNYSMDEGHHIVFAFGRSIAGNTSFMSYVGYEWTFGPHEKGEAPGHESTLHLMLRPNALADPL